MRTSGIGPNHQNGIACPVRRRWPQRTLWPERSFGKAHSWGRAAIIFGVWMSGCGGGPIPAPRSSASGEGTAGALSYRLSIDDELERISVTLCFVGEPPRLLVSGATAAHRFLVDVRHAGTGEALPQTEHAIRLAGVTRGDCVRYSVRLRKAIASGSRLVTAVGEDVMVNPSVFLFRPPDFRGEAILSLDLPEGLSTALPFPKKGEAYVLPESAFRAAGYAAFGRFESLLVEVPGAEIEVAELDGQPGLAPPLLAEWARQAGSAVASIYGVFPAPRALVLAIPVGRGNDPVAFGMIRRGGGPAVMALVRCDADEEALIGDWVLVHEFAHSALPAVDGSWLSEGIATYYQEVLRARQGLRSPLEAWRNIDDGFRRGRRAGTGRTLADESKHMRRTRAFARVYWSGAAYALEADVALRHRSGGRLSLDWVLEKARGLGADGRKWSAAELTSYFDGFVEPPLFEPLRKKYEALTEMPDMDETLARLGIVRGPGGRLTFSSDAPLEGVRSAIMSDGSSRARAVKGQAYAETP